MLRSLVALGFSAIVTACVSGGVPHAVAREGMSTAQASSTESRSMGYSYAEKACAGCHAVSVGQVRSPHPKAPTFEVIANTPGMTPMALNVWLHSSPHRDMPNVRVEADQLDALAEYLYSLKK